MNVIYIIADQMRWDVLGCNGNKIVKTPNLDRLATASINFSCAYSGNPVCVPARGILATGCYSHKCMDPSAHNFNGGEILSRNIHIAKLLHEKKYCNYGIGKAHCLPYKKNPGFDVYEIAEEGRIPWQQSLGMLADDVKEDYLEYLEKAGFGRMQRAHGIGNNDPRAGQSPLPIEHYVDTWATSRSLELLKQHISANPKKPFYLQLGFVKPHAPYDPPAPFDRMYNPTKIPLPYGSSVDLDDRNPNARPFIQNYMINRLSDMAIQYSRSHYFGLITYLDSQLGRILDFIENNNLSNNTMIIFTSDHGDNLGDHGIFFKNNFFEGSVHIPLLLSVPGLKKKINIETPIGQEDIVPSICDVLDIDLPNTVDGKSLLPLVDGCQKHRPFVISQYGSGDKMILMIRDKKFKYCYARYEATEELYDMSLDVYDSHNLAIDENYKTQLIEMRNTADKWCIENSHERLLDDTGNLLKAHFDINEHLVNPKDVMGIRQW
ncbi:MAG: hypothetical protein A2Y10_05710 [Planctomycetes bacterium GWF2_41_51]|nr:MAG: hypothetical protein A2Y10_05710 [Planctomycetes bacterium GWF2_41_51]